MEIIEEELTFLRDTISALRRLAYTTDRQIQRLETRVDDLRRAVQPPKEPRAK